MPNLYVPLLKAKEGELAALEQLHANVKDATVPLLEIADIPFDHSAGIPSKTLDQHISTLPDKILRAWQTREFYLDTPYFGDKDQLREGGCALEALLTACEAKASKPVPVIRLNSSENCLESAKRRAAGVVCIRLTLPDFSEEIDTEDVISSLLLKIGRDNASNLDLMVDIGELPKDQSTALLVARSVIAMIPMRDSWRRVIFSASSFPEDLSGVSSRSTDRIPRKEWILWKSLQKRPTLLPKGLIYSDNTISHPVIKGIDPKVMRMSAAIRYTSRIDWVIVKGSSVGKFGFEQYFDLCKHLVQLPDFLGEHFSWGDRFIADCARSMAGPGNATTWRKVGVNHHITLVTDQLANSDGI